MKTPTVEILSQGEELLTGQVIDTNSAWLSERLIALGFRVVRHTAIGDKLEDMVNVFREIASRSDVCICSGGLGPTTDDLTAQAVSEAFKSPLTEDKIALQQIKAYFRHRQKPMPESNRKQALFPEGALRLDNHWGTAPGFALQIDQCRFFCVPGVPYEMRQLFDNYIAPVLAKEFDQKAFQLVIMRTVNIGESDIQQRVGHLELPETVSLSYRADIFENQTKLLFPPDYPNQAMHELVNKYVAAIGQSVFSVDGLGQDGGSLVTVVGRLLAQRESTVSLLETLSAGQLAVRCDASWLEHTTIISRAARLTKMYGLDSVALDSTEEIKTAAIKIATQLSDSNSTDIAVVQLWAMRENEMHKETDHIQVMTVVGDSCGNIASIESNLTGPIKRVQARAAVHALELLRQFLMELDV